MLMVPTKEIFGHNISVVDDSQGRLPDFGSPLEP